MNFNKNNITEITTKKDINIVTGGRCNCHCRHTIQLTDVPMGIVENGMACAMACDRAGMNTLADWTYQCH